MEICLIAKILITLIGMAGLGFLGTTVGGWIGALIGALGGGALVFFWLSTYLLFWC